MNLISDDIKGKNDKVDVTFKQAFTKIGKPLTALPVAGKACIYHFRADFKFEKALLAKMISKGPCTIRKHIYLLYLARQISIGTYDECTNMTRDLRKNNKEYFTTVDTLAIIQKDPVFSDTGLLEPNTVDSTNSNVIPYLAYLILFIVVVKDVNVDNFFETVKRRWKAFCASLKPVLICGVDIINLTEEDFKNMLTEIDLFRNDLIATVPQFFTMVVMDDSFKEVTYLSLSKQCCMLAYFSRMSRVKSVIDLLDKQWFIDITKRLEPTLHDELIKFQQAVDEVKENYQSAFPFMKAIVQVNCPSLEMTKYPVISNFLFELRKRQNEVQKSNFMLKEPPKELFGLQSTPFTSLFKALNSPITEKSTKSKKSDKTKSKKRSKKEDKSSKSSSETE